LCEGRRIENRLTKPCGSGLLTGDNLTQFVHFILTPQNSLSKKLTLSKILKLV